MLFKLGINANHRSSVTEEGYIQIISLELCRSVNPTTTFSHSSVVWMSSEVFYFFQLYGLSIFIISFLVFQQCFRSVLLLHIKMLTERRMLLHTDYFFHILDKIAQLCMRNVSLYREEHIYFSKLKKEKKKATIFHWKSLATGVFIGK